MYVATAVLSPNPDDEGVWIHQNAWFYLTDIDKEKSLDYSLNDHSNGVYVFVLEGEITVGEDSLGKRDGLGLKKVQQFSIKAREGAQVLIMEVPMHI